MTEQTGIENSFSDGRVLLIDKPVGWTSFDVVKKIRNCIGIKKVGHAGTLDPLATGLLIICTGKYTKRINEYMAQPKEYTGTITLGATTPTYDLESAPGNFKTPEFVTDEMLHQLAKSFEGEQLQMPPAHSAIKQKGKPVYLKARRGEDVVLEPRQINIYAFEITGSTLPGIDFRVTCSTGTYIRSLANDFGARLGCGGYLSALRRTKIGDFNVDDAQRVDEFVRSI